MDITLKEAFEGVDKVININTNETCNACHGLGAKSSKDIEICRDCNGSGRVVSQTGFISFQRTCSRCAGSGQQIKTKCSSCYGQGTVQKERKVEVKIPAGLESGSELRLPGQGDGSKDGVNGDLYLSINVLKDKYFERKGSDLYLSTEITVSEAILGTEIEVPTIDGGYAKLKVSAGTQSETLMRLKSKGMKKYRSLIRGNMYIKIIVKIPNKLNKKQKQLILDFQREEK